MSMEKEREEFDDWSYLGQTKVEPDELNKQEINAIDAILDYKIFVEDTDTIDTIKSKLIFYYLNELKRLEEKYESDKKTLLEYYERNLKQLYQSEENQNEYRKRI